MLYGRRRVDSCVVPEYKGHTVMLTFESSEPVWFGLAVRRSAGKRKDPGSTLASDHLSLETVVVYGHCLVTA